MIENNKILLFGGTGSLGYEIVKRYIDNNIIYNYSRDECKHWKMKLDFNSHPNLHFIIGDIINNNKIEETLLRVKPTIIIIASAMKHIDQCEFNTDQSLNTNLLGVKNILDKVEQNQDKLVEFLKTVLFVSSDKACSPINVYGMCKALSETLVI
jgi:FlaA1/EpsC-like NDP-sugar epimerase